MLSRFQIKRCRGPKKCVINVKVRLNRCTFVLNTLPICPFKIWFYVENSFQIRALIHLAWLMIRLIFLVVKFLTTYSLIFSAPISTKQSSCTHPHTHFWNFSETCSHKILCTWARTKMCTHTKVWIL